MKSLAKWHGGWSVVTGATAGVSNRKPDHVVSIGCIPQVAWPERARIEPASEARSRHRIVWPCAARAGESVTLMEIARMRTSSLAWPLKSRVISLQTQPTSLTP